ncbi:MAG: ester cyclase [Thermomicrobiales bacterium]
MRRFKFLAAAITAVLLLGPALPAATVRAQDATPAACAAGSVEANKQTALDWLQAITDRDLTRFDTLMTADSRYDSATLSDAIGPKAAADIYQSVLDGFTNLVYTADQVIGQDDYVAVRYHVAGDNTGAFRTTPPTGKHITWDGIGIMRFCGGQIAETWMEIDQLARMTQLGTAADVPVVQALAGSAGQNPSAGATPIADLDCPVTSPREAERVFFTWDEAWTTGDTALLDGLLADPFGEVDNDGNGLTLREELAGAIDAYRAAMPDLHDNVTVVFAEGDFVAARWNTTGSMTGDFYGVPATNGPVAYSGNTVLRLQCGRIADVWTEFDEASMLDQMNADWRP